MIRQYTLDLDGRRVGVAEYGDPGGAPVLYCHGFPSSRLEAALVADAAAELGVLLIAAERPGYGLSSPGTEPSVAAAAALYLNVLARLGHPRCGVVGVSGGGPYALAVAAAGAGTVLRTVVACGLGPVYEPATLRTMTWPGRLGFTLARRLPAAVPVVYNNLLAAVLRRRPQLLLGLLLRGAPASDRAVLADPGVRGTFTTAAAEALRQGGVGVWADFRRYVRPWGGMLADIRCPVSLWHGEADQVVAPAHMERLAAGIAGASLRRVPGAGHYALPVRHQREILADALAVG